jgi:FAD/FMN-containing dehydrogenase
MPIAFMPESLHLMRAIKKVFDPKGILNPGKIFPDEV